MKGTNSEEVREMLNAIAANYKSFAKQNADKESILKNWLAAFEAIPKEEAMKALNEYMKRNKFAPAVADIFELLPKSSELSEKELCRRAIEQNKKVYRRITGKEWDDTAQNQDRES